MAKGMFPTKACPNCGEPIHARSKSHLACEWGMDESAAAPNGRRGKKKPPVNGRRSGAGGITVDEIEAVKKLVESIGADKVEQLARVFAR